MKKETRVLGIDDMPFAFSDTVTDIIGAVMRGGVYLEGVLKTTITVDGNDATEKIVAMVTSSRHYGQLRFVMIDGAALGGFNVVDCHRIFAETHIPAMTVTRRKPDFTAMCRALVAHFDDWRPRWETLLRHTVEKIGTAAPVYVARAGLSRSEAAELISLCTVRGVIPEPVRVAHLIATGIKKGESRGRC
jgi:hypothetical protein